MFEPKPRSKKKVDHEALNSPLNRIPGMELAAVRDLLDLGFKNINDLVGRAPESIFEDLRKQRPETPKDRIAAFRLAVYFAETPEPDPKKLHRWCWQD